MKWLLGIIVLFAIVLSTHYIDGCFKKKEKQPVVQYINPLTDTVKHYRDLWNAAHAQVELEINNRYAVDKMHGQQIDSLCRRLHLREKQLQDMAQVIATSSGHIDAPLEPIIIHDTVNGQPRDLEAKTFNWYDDYLRETGIVYPDHVGIDYTISLHFTTSTYWIRKHHFLGIGFGKKIYYFDAFCTNPNVSITGLQAIKIN